MSTRFCLCPPRVSFPSPVSSGGSMVGLMETSSKRAYAILRSPAPRAPAPATDHCLPTPHPETPRNSQASLSQSPVGFLFLSPRSWCAQDFVCSLQESASPVLCKFCNEIPLGSKVKFSGRSQSLFQIPRLGNLLWVLELS